MKASLPGFKFTFTPSWIMCVLTVLLVSLFIKLGFWQIQRAHEKEAIISSFNGNAGLMSKELGKEVDAPSQYQTLQVTGKFLNNIFFLDNQHHNHQFGYDVILALSLDNGKIALIDRGWVASVTRDKKDLPKIEIPKTNIMIEGIAYYPSSKSFVLGENIEKINKDIAIIESQNVKEISKFLHKSVYPFIIRESKNSTGGFVRDWPVVSMAPERHYGYAVQWFGLALVMVVIFVSLNLKKRK